MQFGAYAVATLETPSADGPKSQFGGSVYYLSNRSAGPLLRYSDLAGKRVSFSRPAHVASIAFEAARRGVSLWQDLEAIVMTPDDRVTMSDVLSGFSDAGTMRSDQLQAIQGDCPGCVPPGTFSVVEERVYPSYPFPSSTDLWPQWAFAALPQVARDVVAAVAAALQSDALRRNASLTNANVAGFYLPRGVCGGFFWLLGGAPAGAPSAP